MKRLLAALMMVFALSCAVQSLSAAPENPPANVLAQGFIQGRVTGPDGTTPLGGIEVRAWIEEEEWWVSYDSVYTNPDGTYSLPHAPGVVVVEFTDPDGAFLTEYYDDSTSLWYAEGITVSSAGTTGGVDASLAAAGRIAGKVTGPDGVTPAQDIQVRVYYWDADDEWWYSRGSFYTGPDGTYLVSVVPGDVRLRFSDEAGTFLTEYYNDAATLGGAADLSATAGAVLGNVDASLALAGRIAGTVTGPDGTTPLEDIVVEVYQWNAGWEDWESRGQASTMEDGSYVVGGLNTGTYRIGFYDSRDFHSDEYYDNAPSLDSASEVSVVSGATTAGINASLTEKGKISGTVTGPDGVTPLGYIRVTAYSYDPWDEEWYSYQSVQTAADGTYTLHGLDSGANRIRFYDPAGEFLTEYYNNVTYLGDAQDITVASSTTVSGINASLGAAGRITGTVTGPDGITVLDDASVDVFRWDDALEDWDWETSFYTGSDGRYVVGGLQAGIYRIGFSDRNHISEYYDNVTDFDLATDLTVTLGTTVAGIDASLAEKGRISGKVTGPDGVTPLEGIEVRTYVYDSYYEEWYYDEETYTLSDGTYLLEGLDAGATRIRFRDYDGEFLTEFYNNALTVDVAQDINVPASGTVSGIDASLVVAGSIAGTVTGPDGVTPLDDIYVEVYRWNETEEYWEWENDAVTRSDGKYIVKGLLAGTYRIGFFDFDHMYFSEFYNNALDVNSATDVTVVLGATTGGIDASLATSGRITGRVTGPDGTTPVEDADVEVFQWNPERGTWARKRITYTDENGNYSAGGLQSGTYRVRFTDTYDDYSTEYYDNAPNVETASDVVVVQGLATGGINASLAEKGKISGRVTGPDGITPLEDIQVTAFVYDLAEGGWNSVRSTYTSTDGTYTLQGLDAGTVRLRFRDTEGLYLAEFHDNVFSLDVAQDITVTPSGTVSGINASLSLAGSISGTVTGPDGTTPLEDIYVDVYQWNTQGGYWNWVGYDYTGPDGRYTVGALAAGNYRVGFYDDRDIHISEYFDNATSLNSATDVEVFTEAETSGIDASLDERGRITGVVTGPDSVTPLRDIYVTLYFQDAWDGSWYPASGISTLPDGTYAFDNLAPGSYRLRFDDLDGRFLTEYYNNSSSFGEAEDVVISMGTVHGINASLEAQEPVPPVVIGLRQCGCGSLELDFSGGEGTAYQLQESTDLKIWTDIGDPFSGVNGVNTVFLEASGPQKFWRVRTKW